RYRDLTLSYVTTRKRSIPAANISGYYNRDIAQQPGTGARCTCRFTVAHLAGAGNRSGPASLRQPFNNRTIRPVVPMAMIRQIGQLIAYGSQFGNIFIQLVNILTRQLPHVGAVARGVFPQADQGFDALQ